MITFIIYEVIITRNSKLVTKNQLMLFLVTILHAVHGINNAPLAA